MYFLKCHSEKVSLQLLGIRNTRSNYISQRDTHVIFCCAHHIETPAQAFPSSPALPQTRTSDKRTTLPPKKNKPENKCCKTSCSFPSSCSSPFCFYISWSGSSRFWCWCCFRCLFLSQFCWLLEGIVRIFFHWVVKAFGKAWPGKFNFFLVCWWLMSLASS